MTTFAESFVLVTFIGESPSGLACFLWLDFTGLPDAVIFRKDLRPETILIL